MPPGGQGNKSCPGKGIASVRDQISSRLKVLLPHLAKLKSKH